MVPEKPIKSADSDASAAKAFTTNCQTYLYQGNTIQLKSLRFSLMAQAMTVLQMTPPSEDGMTGSRSWPFKQKVCSASFGVTCTNDNTL